MLKKKDFIKRCYNGPILKHLLKIKQITVFKLFFSMNKYDNNMYLVPLVSCFYVSNKFSCLFLSPIHKTLLFSLSGWDSFLFIFHALFKWCTLVLSWKCSLPIPPQTLPPPIVSASLALFCSYLYLYLFGCYTGDMAVRIPLPIVCVCVCVYLLV